MVVPCCVAASARICAAPGVTLDARALGGGRCCSQKASARVVFAFAEVGVFTRFAEWHLRGSGCSGVSQNCNQHAVLLGVVVVFSIGVGARVCVGPSRASARLTSGLLGCLTMEGVCLFGSFSISPLARGPMQHEV